MMMSIRKWIRKHKTALILSASAAGIGYICYQSVKAHYISVQEREARASLLQQAELRAEAQLQLHFESVQKISDTSTLPMVLPHLKSQLSDQLDLSGLTGKLMQGKDAPQILSGKEKLELWETLKILSFTRSVSSMYSLTLMVLFIRIQLNVLARHVYIDTARDISVKEPVEDKRRGLSRVIQQKYLAFANFLPQKGLAMLISTSKEAVEHVLASKSLREPCTLEDIKEIFKSIGTNLNESKARWLEYMLPESNVLADLCLDSDLAGCVVIEESYDKEKLQNLLDETRAILDSKEFELLLTLAFDVVLDRMIEECAEVYQGRKASSIHFAKLIPRVASLGDLFLEQPDENLFVRALTNLPQLQSFCASVYSAGQEQVS